MVIPACKKTYQEKIVLDLPEMEVPEGGLIAVCGHNGSGKSTFGKILAGIVPADDRKERNKEQRVGYMSQNSVAFHLSVKNNLMQNADKQKSKTENEKRAKKLLEDIGLSDCAGKNAKKLSGGETQRMSLARILMKPYDLLILDEPTASMDRDGVPLAEAMIRNYQKETGCTIFLITHSKEQAERMADALLTLEYGEAKETQGIQLKNN